MRRSLWVMMVFVVFLLVGGCARQASEPAPETAPAQAEQPTLPPPTQPPSNAPSMSQAGNWYVRPENVQDFRARFTLWVSGEGLPQGVSQDTPYWTWTLEATRQPPARRIVVSGSAMGGEQNAMEVIEVEDKMWVRMEDTWVLATGQTPPDIDEDMDQLSGPFGSVDWREVGREQINGFDTVHYRAEVDLPAGTAWGLMDRLAQAMGTEGRITASRFEGDVYVAGEGLVVRALYRLRHTVEAQGKTTQITEEMHYELEGVNLGLTIEIPEMAGQTSGADVPLPEGAQMITAMQGMMVYEVSGSVADVVTFYEQALPAQGFTITSKQVNPMTGGMFMVTKGDQRYIIVIAPSSPNQVQITLQQQ